MQTGYGYIQCFLICEKLYTLNVRRWSWKKKFIKKYTWRVRGELHRLENRGPKECDFSKFFSFVPSFIFYHHRDLCREKPCFMKGNEIIMALIVGRRGISGERAPKVVVVFWSVSPRFSSTFACPWLLITRNKFYICRPVHARHHFAIWEGD